MIIELLRGVTVDIDDIPEDFDEIIQKSFMEYTSETNPEFMYQDKLCYIDTTINKLHKANDSYSAVKSLMLELFEYNVDECGRIPDESDYFDMEFMERCYEQGKADSHMYSYEFSNDRHDNEKIMKLICRIIKVVMMYDDIL